MAGWGRRYIAAQGPGPDTTAAMWQLIWQYEVRTEPVYSKKLLKLIVELMPWLLQVQLVVMLTCVVEGRDQFTTVKCNKYWPDMVGDTGRYGDIRVQLFDQQEVRKQKLKN